MKMKAQAATILIVVLVGLAGWQPSHAQQDQIGIAVGATPEAIEIEDLEGSLVDLGDYIGEKPLLVEFWATWCPRCEALMPQIEAVRAAHGEAVEFLIVAVAVNQSLRRVRRHVENHTMPGRVLWDADGRAVRAFMAPTTSYVVVLDAEGTVVYTGVGEDQDIEAAVKKALGP